MPVLKIKENPGGLSFYINGSLQFDTRDEAVYHESLVAPAAALAAARLRRPLAALVLGGGDGLALREILRSGPVASVQLVDHDGGVLELGRGAFAPYNGDAFKDPRVETVCGDAAAFLAAARCTYDLIVADFTFPGDVAGCSLFTEEFYGRVRKALSPRGLLAVNAVSPERFPAAYWAIYKTLRASGLYPRPLSADIPSFSAHGYGKWGFFFASPRAITGGELAALRLPEGNAFLNSGTLRAGMRFDQTPALFGAGLSSPVKNPVQLLSFVHLPPPNGGGGELDFFSRSNRALFSGGFPGDPALWGAETIAAWEDRLAEVLRAFDWERLLAEAGGISTELAQKLRTELYDLKEEFKPVLSGTDRAEKIYRVLAVLAVLLIMINMAYPDNAFAKGSYGHGGGSGEDISFFAQRAASPFHGPAFQGMTAAGLLVPDSMGKMYPAISLNGGIGREKAGDEKFIYALTSDIRLAADGTAFMALPPSPYAIRLGASAFVVEKQGLPGEIFRLKPDLETAETINTNIQLQQKALDAALAAHRKWLSWAAPAGALLPEIKGEAKEMENMLAIKAVFEAALPRLGQGLPRIPGLPGYLKLAPGVYAGTDTGAIVLLRDDGDLVCCVMPGFPVEEEAVRLRPSPELAGFLRAVMTVKGKMLPAGNPARRLGEMQDDEYQRLVGGI